jgi:lysyl-tRNA synthetase class II
MPCHAEPVSSTDLINNAKEYDAKTVSYQGEVIGDVMVRGNNAWINVNDKKNAIGIWLSSGLTKEISYTGSYKSKGDIIEVEGVFHRSCLEHGGDLDIHAKTIKLIIKGYETKESISPVKVKAVIVFLIICLTLAVIYFIRLFYSKKK